MTGKLYLYCYSGTCSKTEVDEGTTYECTINRDDDGYETRECKYIPYRETHYIFDIIYSCSKQCFNESKCDVCPIDYDNEQGVCSKKDDDSYSSGKLCFGDNIIYFRKGKLYIAEKITLM